MKLPKFGKSKEAREQVLAASPVEQGAPVTLKASVEEQLATVLANQEIIVQNQQAIYNAIGQVGQVLIDRLLPPVEQVKVTKVKKEK